MSLNKFMKWLPTASGQQFCCSLGVSAAIGSFLVYYLPNTFFLEKYQNIIALYKSGFPVPLSSDLKKKFEKALEYCEVSEEDKDVYRPFHVTGFEVYSAGTWYSKFGSIIGIPINFTYDTVENIDRTSIKIGGETVSWSLPESKEFLSSLILSEEAQIYAMCREIKMCEYPKLLVNTFSTTTCVGATYAISHVLNNKLLLRERPLGFRLIMYSLVTAFTVGNYFLSKDLCQVFFETKIDRELKEKDPKLAKGGVEYYDQILKRNVALRKLMGKTGESMYTSLGNENYFIRNKHIPVIHRRDFFKDEVEAN